MAASAVLSLVLGTTMMMMMMLAFTASTASKTAVCSYEATAARGLPKFFGRSSLAETEVLAKTLLKPLSTWINFISQIYNKLRTKMIGIINIVFSCE